MKKFTLEFINPELEIEFQNTKIIGVQKPVYKWLAFCGFGYEIAGATQSWIMGQKEKAIFPIIIASVLFINLVSSIRYPQTMKINQIISVYIALLTLFDKSTANTIYDFYVYGATVQLWQCCIISMCGFKHSLHLITITTIFRVSVLLFYTATDYRDAFGAFITASTFLVQNYLSDKIDRSQYLLTKKDLRWQQYMPTIIEKSYFIFEYDKVQQSFISNEQSLHDFLPYNVSKNITLRTFLRSAQINNQTLELHLFKYYLQTHAQITTLQVLYNRQLLTIKLYDLNIQNNQFLIIINQPQISKSYQINNQSRQMLQYAKFVRNNMKINNNKQKVTDRLFKVKAKIINNLFLSSLRIFNEKIAVINLAQLIFKCQQMYILGYKMKVEIDSLSSVYIKSYQSKVFAYINYLFLLFHQQYLIQSQNIKITLEDCNHDTIQLKISVPYIDILLNAYSKIQCFKHLEYTLLHSPLNSNLELKFMRELENIIF